MSFAGTAPLQRRRIFVVKKSDDIDRWKNPSPVFETVESEGEDPDGENTLPMFDPEYNEENPMPMFGTED